MLRKITVLTTDVNSLDAKTYYLPLPSGTLEGKVYQVDVLAGTFGTINTRGLKITNDGMGDFGREDDIDVLNLNISFPIKQNSILDIIFLLENIPQYYI